MKVLILGANGMLGHQLFRKLGPRFDIYVTFREPDAGWRRYPLYADLKPARAFGGIEALNFDSVVRIVEQVKPQAVINSIGIVKQRAEAKSAIPSIQINALFPHRLAGLCETAQARLIHVSTDCVFSGNRGHYTEDDLPDPVDLYGRTKLLGELNRPGCLTLRTSIIGWELKHRAGLLEWFAAQRGHTIKGYRGAVYTGLSTAALAGLINDLLENHPELSGLYHVAAQPITKYELLARLREALGWHNITIEPNDAIQCDRSLISTRFKAATGWPPPTWDTMTAELATEWLTYLQWRKSIQ